MAIFLSPFWDATGLNFTFWTAVSFIRYIVEEALPQLGAQYRGKIVAAQKAVGLQIRAEEVGVILAAHNEELALPATIEALKKNVPVENIYIGSDASTDRTVEIAKRFGCHVIDLHPNRGKARTLSYLVNHFQLLDRYKALLIMDAEVVVADDYVAQALPYFNDPEVGVFVGHCISRWQPHRWPKWSMFFTAYRVKLWRILYYSLRYGQTWKYTNVTPIIPGGSSIYRTSVLKNIEIDTPGLVIEDFHMTFQVHRKKLGKIASHPKATILDQEPYTMRDYCRQITRWFLGFWQTYNYHGPWLSFFWIANTLFLIEMMLYSLFILAAPIIAIMILIGSFEPVTLLVFRFNFLRFEPVEVTMTGLLVGFFAVDYTLTALVAFIDRRPIILFYGLGFFILRYIEAFIFLWTLPLSIFLRNSQGIWSSPVRKGVPVSAS